MSTEDLNIDFFSIANEQVPAKGSILISEPFLADTYFRRSVVFLTEHSEDGSIGFVLNKALEMNIADVIEDFPEGEYLVSIGGPVGTNTIHYLHTMGDLIPGSILVKDGIFWGGDFDEIRKLAAEKRIDRYALRFFLGYSGWSPDQLDGEIKEHAWLIGSIPGQLVMEARDAAFWNRTLERYKNKYRAWAHFPEDPSFN